MPYIPESANPLTRAIIVSYVIVSCFSILFEQLNIHVHHNSCESQNLDMRYTTMKHLFIQDQKFYDLNETSHIRGKMRFDCINNQMAWNVP